MERAKKMLLIPHDELQRINSSYDSTTQLDQEMAQTLKEKKLTDEEKWIKYNQILQKYLYVTKQQRQPIQLPINTDISEQEDNVFLNELLGTIPDRYARKGLQLFNFLKTRPDVITWSKDGVISIGGATVDGSHLVDLLNDALRERKNYNPKGWQNFAYALGRLNVPRELVGNPKRWRYISQGNNPYQEGFGACNRRGKKTCSKAKTKWSVFKF